MRRMIVLICFILLAATEVSWTRTLEEIRRSGTIVFAISENPTVYDVSGQAQTGFDHSLALLLAKYLGVKPKFVIVMSKDYFVTDIYKTPILLKVVDIYADHLLLSTATKNLVLPIPLYQGMKVCVYHKRKPLKNLSDLPKLKTERVNGEDHGFFKTVEEKIGRPLNIQTVGGIGDQVRDLLVGSIDYIIMDSDQAFYYAGKNPGLAIDMDMFKDLVEIYDIGWATARENTALKKEAADLVNTLKTGGEFYKLWQQTYQISFSEYRDALKIIEKKGDELFRKGLDYAFNKQYEESIALFQTVKKMKLASEKVQRLYDTIYIDWLRSVSGEETKKQAEIVDKYMRSDPSPYFISYIRENKAPLFRYYNDYLKKQRNEFLNGKRITNAVEVQSLISILNPDVQNEKQIYDDIYIAMLKEKEQQNNTDVLDFLDDYIKEKPSPYFFTQLKTKLPVLYDDYVYKLKADRDNALGTLDLDRAIKLQETVVMMVPGSFEEENALRVLSLKTGINERTTENKKILVTLPSSDDGGGVLLDPGLPVGRKKLPTDTGGKETGLSNVLAQGEKGIENHEGKRYFQIGLMNLESKSYNDALGAFQSAKSLSFKADECAGYIKQIIDILNRKAKAEEEKKRAIFADYFGKAITFYLKEDYSPALENIMVCLNLYPENPEAKKYSEIISDNLRYEGEKTIGESSPYYLYFLNRSKAAEQFFGRGDYQSAKKIYEEILTIFPNNELAKQQLINCLFKLDRPSMEKVIKEYFKEAKSLFSQKKYREAFIKFSFVKKIDPGFPELDSYLERSKISKPVREKDTVPKDFNYDGSMNTALEEYSKGNLKKALAIYRRILGYYPDDYKALLNSSRIENELRHEPNLDAGNRLNSKIREKSENIYLKGLFFFRIGSYKKALEMWEESYRIDPSYRKAMIDIQRVKLLMVRSD